MHIVDCNLAKSRLTIVHLCLALRLATALVLELPAQPARADGDDFFAYRSRSLNPDGTRVAVKNGFIGSVRDVEGNYISDATITIAVHVRYGEEIQTLTYNSYTDNIGRYHSLDAAGVVSDLMGIQVDLKPNDLEAVGVEKDGYVQVRRITRSRPGQTGVIEVDFIVKRIR